jgi:hypothetical protein
MTYDGKAITTTPVIITSAANGAFSATFIVPSALQGDHIVIATDGENAATTVFNSIVTATLSPVTSVDSPGYVGLEITIDGKGFAPGGIVTVKYDNSSVATATVSNLGVFNVKFKSRSSYPGAHKITVSDGINSITFNYNMEAIAPAAPAGISPLDLMNVKQPLTFEWSPVSDPSGVSYTVQISQDPDFAVLLLNVSGLTDPTYIMTEAEKLPSSTSDTPYLWRVIAVDGAGNTSPPSAVQSFSTGFSLDSFPPILVFIIGTVSPILLFGSVYVIGRRLFGPANPRFQNKAAIS